MHLSTAPLRPVWIWALCLALLAAGLLLDGLAPLGVAAGIVYLAAVLAAVGLPRPGAPLLLAAAGSALTAAGYFLSPPAGDPTTAMTNRVLTIAALWAVALALWSRERANRAYRQVAEDLRKAQAIAHFGDFELHPGTGGSAGRTSCSASWAATPGTGRPASPSISRRSSIPPTGPA